ncbi:MAG: long-chain fatty acid--CoA ligase [Acidobacteria bacterium]|nr:MAG: long-chain fatty acid--CoA ligase [Acidobacteriota bacterium]
MIEDHIPEILGSLPRRTSDVVTPWVERSPNRPALIEPSGTWTYKQLSLASASARAWLLDSGVRPGDRVMIVCENCRAFIAILLALAELDAWPVLANARLSAREIDQVREHCGARRVIYTTSISHHAREHAKRHGASILDVAEIGRIGEGPLNETVETEPVDTKGPDAVAALIYTSGTTGQPKGVMLTHRGVLFVAAISAQIRSLTPEDNLLGVLPMSHAVGLSVVLLGTLLTGATLQLSSRFDPVAVLSALEKDQLTIILGAPAMFGLFVEYAKLKGLRSMKFRSLRIIASAGAPLQAAIKSETEALFGLPLHNGYGVTECSPTIAQTRVESPRTDLSIGRVFPGVEVKLIGPDGQPVPDGGVGELCARGPNVMKGYYRAPMETRAAIDAEGWYNTHDLARFENGNLFIVGRSKELIVRFGFNVYPAEVEAAFTTHTSVLRCAVIGRPAESEGGEEVIAFIQLAKDSKLTADELANHAAQQLAPYKRPSQIFFVDTMPVTPTGKIVKDELAKMAAPARIDENKPSRE